MNIAKIMKLSAEIQNFCDCYNDTTNHLYAKRTYIDGKINPEDLLGFLLENPHLAEIALKIKDLECT